jgi:hypothetical protein
MINPPVRKNTYYWTNDELPAKPDARLKDARQHEGLVANWMTGSSRISGRRLPRASSARPKAGTG